MRWQISTTANERPTSEVFTPATFSALSYSSSKACCRHIRILTNPGHGLDAFGEQARRETVTDVHHGAGAQRATHTNQRNIVERYPARLIAINRRHGHTVYGLLPLCPQTLFVLAPHPIYSKHINPIRSGRPLRRKGLGLLKDCLYSGVLKIGWIPVLAQDALHEHPHAGSCAFPARPVNGDVGLDAGQ